MGFNVTSVEYAVEQFKCFQCFVAYWKDNVTVQQKSTMGKRCVCL